MVIAGCPRPRRCVLPARRRRSGLRTGKRVVVAALSWLIVAPALCGTIEGREALAQLRVAAEQGDADAQYRLGYVYQRGLGTPSHPRQAEQWYLRAARQGHPLAQFELGQMYRKGEQIPRDEGAAFQWLHSAAEHGLSRAQYILGVMYRDAVGHSRDYVQAHKWFEIARAGGHRFAARARDALGSNMSAAQIREAGELARVWLMDRRYPKP